MTLMSGETCFGCVKQDLSVGHFLTVLRNPTDHVLSQCVLSMFGGPLMNYFNPDAIYHSTGTLF